MNQNPKLNGTGSPYFRAMAYSSAHEDDSAITAATETWALGVITQVWEALSHKNQRHVLESLESLSRTIDEWREAIQVAEGQGRCLTCGNMKDTPMHELGCDNG